MQAGPASSSGAATARLRAALDAVGQATPNLLLLPGGTMNLLTGPSTATRRGTQVLKDVLAGPKRRMLPAGKVNDEHLLLRHAGRRACPLRRSARGPAPRRTGQGGVRSARRAGNTRQRSISTRAIATATLSRRAGFRRPASSACSSDRWLAKHEMESRRACRSHARAGRSTSSGRPLSPTGAMRPGLQSCRHASLVIESDDGDIPVIVDGEAIEAGDTVRVSYVKEAAQCLTAG